MEIEKEAVVFFEKLVKKIPEANYLEVLKYFFRYNERKIDRFQLENVVSNVLSDYPNLRHDFKLFVKDSETLIRCNNPVPNNNNNEGEEEERSCKKRSKDDDKESVDVKSCSSRENIRVRVGEIEYHIAIEDENWTTEREDEESEEEVVNNNLVCVAPKKEESKPARKKTRRIDKYEQVKMKRDDDRNDADVLMIWLRSAADYAKRLPYSNSKNERNSNSISKNNFIRCVERLYGDYGPVVLELCRTNPRFASDLVLSRLNQKIHDLMDFTLLMDKIWVLV